jgi:uncharacterized protein (TIGR03437 family)
MPNTWKFAALVAVTLAAAEAQSAPGYGWSSWGVLPFRAYDFVLVKAPTQYILYFTKHPTDRVGEGPPVVPGRAFSKDLKTWTADPNDACEAGGDLCRFSRNRVGALTLPDGRIRMYINTGGGLSSLISTDGLVWTAEPGLRLAADNLSIYEHGNFALQLASFVTLADGSVRMYYEGGIQAGSPGTPSYYGSTFYNGAILSAISKDNGATFVREAGVRVNPLVQGPTVVLPAAGGGTNNQFSGADVTAVAVKEGGRTVYRIFAPSLVDGAVSYVSEDGLSFVLEGQAPAMDGDPKAFVLPDGRIWLVTNQYPDAIADVLVYGPQTLFLDSERVDAGRQPGSGFAAPFHSTLMGIRGASTGPVTLEAAASNPGCALPDCTFHPEYFSFAPASGTPPFSTQVTYTGPPDYSHFELVVHAKSADATAAAALTCLTQPASKPGHTVFCGPDAPLLPRNTMAFGVAPGGAVASQVSDILALGGNGYPYTARSSAPWATVSPASGTAPQPLTVSVNPAGMAPGTYTGTVTVAAEGTEEKISVTMTVSAGPVITSVQNAARADGALAPNSFLTIYGTGFADAPVAWSPATALPTTLGGVKVRIGGKEAFISYASVGQVNVLTPPDLAVGAVALEVSTAAGVSTVTLNVSEAAPEWFTYSLAGTTRIAALIAGTAVYVAPAGSIGAGLSRPAEAADFVSLYANALGNTTPAPPPGVVLTTVYPLGLERVKVTIGGKSAAAQFAGLVAPGLYQVNVQIPAGLTPGDAAVVMAVDGRVTESGVIAVQ